MRDRLLSDIPPDTQLTVPERHDIEAEAIRRVRGKEKTVKSGWIAGVGPVEKKKDLAFRAMMEGGQSGSAQADALSRELADVKLQLAESQRQYERLAEFMSSRFPDFPSDRRRDDGASGSGGGGEENIPAPDPDRSADQ